VVAYYNSFFDKQGYTVVHIVEHMIVEHTSAVGRLPQGTPCTALVPLLAFVALELVHMRHPGMVLVVVELVVVVVVLEVVVVVLVVVVHIQILYIFEAFVDTMYLDMDFELALVVEHTMYPGMDSVALAEGYTKHLGMDSVALLVGYTKHLGMDSVALAEGRMIHLDMGFVAWLVEHTKHLGMELA